MTKQEWVVFEDVANSVDALLYECLVDIPQALGYEPNDTHDAIVEFIIDRVKQTHKRYIDEEEDE
jgi:hypothetical protein